MEFDVKDGTGNPIYKITSPCLQMGFLCWQFGFLEACAKRKYEIRPHDGGEVVGEIENIYHGIVNELYTRADKYGIRFPDGANVDTKLILIQTAIFLDYLQYMA